MPPQPIPKSKANAKLWIKSAIALTERELASLAAGAIALSAQIENLYSAILTSMLGADAKPAVAMLGALRAQHAQTAVIHAAAEAVLSEDYLEVFGVITKLANEGLRHRNRFAHWVWAYSPEIPDAIIFLDPKGLLEYEMKENMVVSNYEGRNVRDTFDRKYSLVYRKKDFDEAVKQLLRAEAHLARFRFCVVPFIRAGGSPALDSQLQVIKDQPDIAKALSEARASRQGDPSKPRAHPRKGRRAKSKLPN